MTEINYPTMCVEHMHTTDIYLSADDSSVNQYCTENSYSLVSYDKEYSRFSNDGALPYQYYSGGKWVFEFGFKDIVTKLIVS